MRRARDAPSTSAVSAGIRVARGAPGPGERRARRLRPETPHRDPRDHELVDGLRRRREGRGVEPGERALGLGDAPDQEEAPDLEMPRVRGVGPVPVLFERRPRRRERPRRPAQVARDQRDLRLGDDAPRAGHCLFRIEGPPSTSQERLRANEIAELRHRDASERERRRVVAQGDPLQRPEGITRGQGTRRGRDQRVHRNPVTLVTPTAPYLALHLSHGRPARAATAVPAQASTGRGTKGPRPEEHLREGEKSDDAAQNRDT